MLIWILPVFPSVSLDVLIYYRARGVYQMNDETPHLVVADEAVLPHVGGEGGHPTAGRVEGPGVEAAEGHGGPLPGAEVGCTVLYCGVLYCTVVYCTWRGGRPSGGPTPAACCPARCG